MIRQDFLHELMVAMFVDDGSKDETLPVVESFPTARAMMCWKDTFARGTTLC